jgi:hypothetical protein
MSKRIHGTISIDARNFLAAAAPANPHAIV